MLCAARGLRRLGIQSRIDMTHLGRTTYPSDVKSQTLPCGSGAIIHVRADTEPIVYETQAAPSVSVDPRHDCLRPDSIAGVDVDERYPNRQLALSKRVMMEDSEHPKSCWVHVCTEILEPVHLGKPRSD